jgi:hypothetical protein
MKKIASVILVFITSNFIYSQKHELGKVTIEELTEKSHPIDSSAVAAILFKVGEVHFEFSPSNGFEMITTVKTKIKIYKKEGYEWANHSERFFVGDNNAETLGYKNVATYNLVDGKIEKTKLKSDGEFSEKVNKFWSIKKISLPNVKVGSIIEFEYYIKTNHIGTIDNWDFQYSIPVNFSEYKTFIPEYYVYNPIQKGYVFPTVKKVENSKSFVITSKERSEGLVTKTTYSDDKIEYLETATTYTIKDVPALKNEAFVNNINNYISSITHELSMTRYPNEPYKTYSTDWETITKTIYNSDDFGGELNKTGYFEEDVKVLLKDITSYQEKIAILFNYVKSNVKWNEYYGYSCNDGVRKAYKDKTGNVAEINLMLTAMLRYAGIESNPVLVSTRSNGISFFPNRTAYNYVISAVEIQDGLLLLDATSQVSLPNILPIRDLNWFGRIIRKDGTSASVNLATISSDGKVEGKVREQHFDYNAFTFRDRFGTTAKESYLEFLEKKHNNIEINEYEVKGKQELSEPIVENYSFKSNNSIETIGDKMYFSPLLFLATKENPFKQEKREYPVDFVFPSQDRFLINITIPDGYAIESLPTSVSIPMSDELFNAKFLISGSDNKIQISYTKETNTSIIPAEYYEELKAVFNEIVKQENEKIVLKKI